MANGAYRAISWLRTGVFGVIYCCWLFHGDVLAMAAVAREGGGRKNGASCAAAEELS